MNPNVKEATGYIAVCPVGCRWQSNLCVSAEDAEASLAHHTAERHPSEEEGQ